MSIHIISFTDRGQALADRLAELLPGEAVRCGRPLGLAEWTAGAFSSAEALVFVGAVGIAVRAIAPHMQSKAVDPAVVAVDETGRFAVPLLSGHLGGANDLARRIGALCGAEPVITTATDRNGVFAVDAWARVQGCAVRNPEKIKEISAALLAGETVRLRSGWPIAGTPPVGVVLTDAEDCDVLLSCHETDRAVLQIVPRLAVVGVGCKRGTAQAAIEAAVRGAFAGAGLLPEAAAMVCSIDRKGEEPGLLAFCRDRGLPLKTFPAEALRGAEGDFSASDFVREITGVDNVCERSAVLGSGGKLLVRKQAGNGVTVAVAVKPFSPDWRWQDG